MTTQISSDAQPAQEQEWHFEPAVCIDALDTEEDRDFARSLIMEVREEHVEEIEQLVACGFEQHLQAIPPTIASAHADAITEEWLLAHYFSVVFDVVVGRFVPDDAAPPAFAFEPELPTAALPPGASRDDAMRLVTLVTSDHVLNIAREIDAAFAEYTAGLPANIVTKYSTDLRQEWLPQHYYDLVRKVLDAAIASPNTPVSFGVVSGGCGSEELAAAGFAFEPEVPTSTLPPGASRDDAMRLTALVKCDHVLNIAREVDAAFAEYTAGMPVNIVAKYPTELRQEWLPLHYYDLVRKVLDAAIYSPGTPEPWSFTPVVDPAALPAGAQREEAERLVSLVRKEHVLPLEAIVVESFEAFTGQIPGFLADAHGSLIANEWLEAHYFELVRRAVGAPLRTEAVNEALPSPSTPASASERVDDPRGRAMPDSPMLRTPQRKRARRTDVQAAPAYSLVRELHHSEVMPGAHCTTQAIILFVGELRNVSTTSKSGQVEAVPVLSLILGDLTGPIALECWRASASTAAALFEGHAEGAPAYVDMENLLVKTDGRAKLIPFRRLTSTDRTRMTRLEQPTQRGLLDTTIAPDATLFLTDFTLLQSALPYIVSLKGTIAQVSEQAVSQNNVDMLSFRLVDERGNWVSCIGFGRHGASDEVSVGAVVILYFCVGKKSLNNGNGKLWLYDDAHIALLSSDTTTAPMCKREMVF